MCSNCTYCVLNYTHGVLNYTPVRITNVKVYSFWGQGNYTPKRCVIFANYTPWCVVVTHILCVLSTHHAWLTRLWCVVVTRLKVCNFGDKKVCCSYTLVLRAHRRLLFDMLRGSYFFAYIHHSHLKTAPSLLGNDTNIFKCLNVL